MSAPATLGTFVAAAVLLDGLNRDNEDIGAEERINGTAREKIGSAGGWFAILCGVGEDGDWPEESIRDLIRQDLYTIRHQIKEEQDSPASHFRRWPAVASSVAQETVWRAKTQSIPFPWPRHGLPGAAPSG